MAVSYSAIINGGYLLQPNIVEKIEKENNTIKY
jgi:cell division protein FtsI/penicillin-binding protein 2